MSNILSLVGKIISWILFIGIFASIGLATENPAVMVPAYGIGMALILGLILFSLSLKKRQSLESIEIPVYLKTVDGVIAVLLSFIIPVIAMNGALYFLQVSNGVTILFTLLFIGLGTVGVWLINVLSQKLKILALLGYLVLIFTSALPAWLIAPVDASISTLGVLYIVVIAVSCLFWYGFTRLYKVINKIND